MASLAKSHDSLYLSPPDIGGTANWTTNITLHNLTGFPVLVAIMNQSPMVFVIFQAACISRKR